jgi:hypothetical protein
LGKGYVWFCLGAIFTLALASFIPAASSAGATLAKFEPADGAYLGGVIASSDPAAKNASILPAWDQAVGKKAAVRLGFRYFTGYDTFGNATSHPETDLQHCAAAGVTPMITWQFDRSNMDAYRTEDAVGAVANGTYDNYIRERARECKAFGQPVFIRLGHEFNYGGYAWSKHPAEYVKAWQRVVDIFRQEGATNVAFVWCANFPSRDYPPTDANGGLAQIDPYYPGDGYVDWVGMDCYNIPDYERNLTRMLGDPSNTNGFYYKYCVQKGKPLYLGEVGCAESLTNTKGWPVSTDALNKARWLHDWLYNMEKLYPKVKGFTYWNTTVGGNYALYGSWTYGGKTDIQWVRSFIGESRYLSKVVTSAATPTSTPTPTATITPTPTATPATHAVDSTHRYAKYNNTYKPIEQLVVKKGTAVEQGIMYKNTGSAADTYVVTVTGLPSSWYTIRIYGQNEVSPGDVRYGGVTITPATAGTYKFTVKVASRSTPGVYDIEAYTLIVK